MSDIHLTLNQPSCRADKDWMEVQARYLLQLKALAGDLPILCAGDIFDRWNPPPELINFALKHLPDRMFCVPGQHDLPNHRLDQMHRSGYGVLKEARKIVNIDGYNGGGPWGFSIWGFGWGREVVPIKELNEVDDLSIAVIHQYCWVNDKCFPGAPEASHVNSFRKSLKGYDVAVFGDNHKGFISRIDGKGGKQRDCFILNCGGFIRRKSDEIDYQPALGAIYANGSVKRIPLDTSIDKFHEGQEERKEIPINMREFISQLEGLGEHGLNFREAVENHLKSEEIEPETAEIIRRALEEKSQ